MNDTELWRLISEKVSERRESIIHAMTAGHYPSIERYRQDVGFLAGLKFVEDVVKDIYQPKERDDEHYSGT